MNKLFIMMTSLSLLFSENVFCSEDVEIIRSESERCNHCHGTNGINHELPGPNLVGQNSLYLIKQINLFLKGSRIHPVLGSDSFKPDRDEVQDLANYYANSKTQLLAYTLIGQGELLYSPCSSCHGTMGEGVGAFPRLNGLKPAYLQKQLNNFKTGLRQNSVMQAMTINLSNEEIELLAFYLSSNKKL